MSRTGIGGTGLGDGGQLDRNLAFLESGDTGASEFSWGDGLEPAAVRGLSPSEGGRYTGVSPDCPNQIGLSRRDRLRATPGL